MVHDLLTVADTVSVVFNEGQLALSPVGFWRRGDDGDGPIYWDLMYMCMTSSREPQWQQSSPATSSCNRSPLLCSLQGFLLMSFTFVAKAAGSVC